MPGPRETTLQGIANTVQDLLAGQIPTAAEWNQVRDAVQAALPMIGSWLDGMDTDRIALRALFDADHNPSTGANPAPDEFTADAAAPTFVAASQFTLPGNRLADYAERRRIRVTVGGTPSVVTVTAAAFQAGPNTTLVTVTPATLSASLTAVAYPLVRASLPLIAAGDLAPGAVTAAALAPASVGAGHLTIGASLYFRGGAENPAPRLVSTAIETLHTIALTTRGGPIEVLFVANVDLDEEDEGTFWLEIDGVIQSLGQVALFDPGANGRDLRTVVLRWVGTLALTPSPNHTLTVRAQRTSVSGTVTIAHSSVVVKEHA